jgi:hypothetical protein
MLTAPPRGNAAGRPSDRMDCGEPPASAREQAFRRAEANETKLTLQLRCRVTLSA